MYRLVLLSLFAAACAPPAADRWPDALALPLNSDAELDRGSRTVLLPIQVYLWSSMLDGCGQHDCPSTRTVGNTVVVETDCTDDDGVGWSGGMTIEDESDGVETHIYDDLGWERDGVVVTISGLQQVTSDDDGEAVLQSDGLELFLSGGPGPLSWPDGPTALVYGEHSLIVDEQSWSVHSEVLIQPENGEFEDGESGWLSLSGAGWADEHDTLHGSLVSDGDVFDVSGTTDDLELTVR